MGLRPGYLRGALGRCRAGGVLFFSDAPGASGKRQCEVRLELAALRLDGEQERCRTATAVAKGGAGAGAAAGRA